MPETAHDEHDSQVAKNHHMRYPTAAQRVVHIIAEPCGEGDVPALPKLLDGMSKVRLAKIHHEVVAHDLGDSSGDVGIAGEITIDLHREIEGGKQQYGARVVERVGVHNVDRIGHQVCDTDLLDHSPQRQLHAGAEIVIGKRLVFVKLMQKVLRALDRARHQLRKEHHKQREESKVVFDFLTSAVHVDGVGQRLKHMERNANWQNEMKQRKRDARILLARLSEKKLKYLKTNNSPRLLTRLIPSRALFILSESCPPHSDPTK